jgi:hypothetical protein
MMEISNPTKQLICASLLKDSNAYRNGIAVSNEVGDLFIIDETMALLVSRKDSTLRLKEIPSCL